MFLGILEPKSTGHVPGTVLLQLETGAQIDRAANLKKGTGRNANIVLVPQPSDDPNDPLNWPLWQKDVILALYCTCCLLCVGGIGPLLSSSALVLVEAFHIDFTKVSQLSGYSLCATGACGIFISALCHKYGKRPIIIFSMSSALAGTIWGGAAQSYNSLLGARVVQGLGVSMFESIMFAVIGDLYFVHQRGARMAIVTTSISGISNLPAMLAGVITENLGWRWMFWMLAIFMGIAWAGTLLFGWETAYCRDKVYNLDTSSQDNMDLVADLKQPEIEHQEVAHTGTATSANTGGGIPRKRMGIFKRMKPWSGNTFTDQHLLTMIVRPFFVITNPAAIWACLVLAFSVLWSVAISYVVAQIFAAPPFLLNTAQLGYMSAGPVVGGTLGCLLAGAIADPVTEWITKKNGGKYEPEFRLWVVFLLLIFAALGYFMFGNFIAQGKAPIAIACVWALVTASAQFAAVAVGTYVVDAYRDLSIEIFIMSMVFKNFLFFGFSYFVNDWITNQGPARAFNTMGGIQMFICLTTVPLWFYGKRLRAWWHTHDYLASIGKK